MGRAQRKDRQEEFVDTKGVIRGRTQTKDKQQEFEDTNGASGAIHLRRKDKNRRKIQKSTKGRYTEEGHTRRA